MRHAAIVIEGILRDPVSGQPDEHGRAIYHALANNYRISLLADDKNGEKLTDWCFTERFTRHTKLALADVVHAKDLKEIRLTQIRKLRALGDVDLVITPEPDLVDDLYAMGQPHLLYVQPKHLGELPPRETWDQLTARIDADRQRAALHDEDT